MLRTARTLALAAALLSACSDDQGGSSPTQESPDRPSGVLARVTPDALPQEGLATSLASAAPAKSDSTDDICDQSGPSPETCAIQGGAATGSVFVDCVGSCVIGTYQWSIQNPPPSSTTTFTPAITSTGQLSRYAIQTTDATPPGLYQSEFVPTPLNGSPPPNPATVAVTVHVLCSFRLKKCPELEILDTLRSNAVVSAPAPTQTTVIGKAVRLRTRHKPGTGTGPYTLESPSWNGTGTVVKNYELDHGQLTPLTPADLQDSLLGFYWTTASGRGTYVVQAQAILVRTADGARSNPKAKATYSAKGPTSVKLTSTATQVRVGTYDAQGDSALSFGTQLARPTSSGILFTFTATEPSEDQGGYVSATQLIRTQSQYTRNPAGNPDALTFPSTDGGFWLDACPLYPGVGFANGTLVQADNHGRFKYQADDAPASLLTFDFNVVTRADAFQTYFMYRPSGSESIWVPLGALPWSWGGTATRTISNPDVGNVWTGPTGSSQSVGPSSLSAAFPQWPTTFLMRSDCSALPPS